MGEVYFKLINDNGVVHCCAFKDRACKEPYENGFIFGLAEEGVYRHYPVNPVIGLPLDEKGRVKWSR